VLGSLGRPIAFINFKVFILKGVNVSKTDDNEIKYVGITNPSMVQLSIRKVSKLYTHYAQIILDLKKLRDMRRETKKRYINKVKDLSKMFDELMKLVPQLTDKELGIKKAEIAKRKVEVVQDTRSISSFDDLRFEFERLKRELEKI